MRDLRQSILALSVGVLFVLNSAYALSPKAPRPAEKQAPESQASPRYETRENHDPDGTGKFYMGREIAQVMGPGGIEWLDRRDRDEEEHPAQVLEALHLQPGEVVADLGAGSGFFTFRMAPKVGATGKILAVDVQQAMLQTMRARAATRKVTNVEVIQGSETDPHLPAGSVDLVLIVDVYHELAYPYEVMSKVRESLKPKGRVVFVEYRKEDPAVRIKQVHKMSVQQLDKEMSAVGLVRVCTIETLPLQHIVIFEKKQTQE
jgi:ubiquinone/menaquinone biosynthesis C-methylase UbiE